ncbi:uncharacterized protein DNG_08890 [Cephalotrichum gorgonifer]|uniref:SET domain-containing protein n=1 Tax=Cephalotrichum gorgonifer TaxID=2041049 RepID=A0AAE8N4I1_9PEZI|nr:uncharacterized protein DNG_08890 [Cephalotrichum gorgonifer]
MSIPENFAEWAAVKGVVLTGVEPRQIPGRGIGIMTAREVKAGEILVQVPLSCFRTKQTVPATLAKKVPGISIHGLLAASLALENARNDAGSAPWRSVFPTPQDLSCMPLLWPASLQRLLPRPARDLVAKQAAKVDSDWKAASQLGVERDEYVYRWLLVNTRSFYHAPAGGRTAGCAPGEDKMALVPVADLLNHAPSGECKVTFSSRGLSIAADRAYALGEEIHICYGRHGSDFLLAEYGFLPDGNEWDEVCLDDALLSRLTDAQKDELERLGFLGRWRLDPRTPGCFRTQVALRVLCGCPVRDFVNGAEKEGVQGVVDVYFGGVLAEFLNDIGERVREIEGLGAGDEEEREVLVRRWKQIAELVEGAKAQLIQQQ